MISFEWLHKLRRILQAKSEDAAYNMSVFTSGGASYTTYAVNI